MINDRLLLTFNYTNMWKSYKMGVETIFWRCKYKFTYWCDFSRWCEINYLTNGRCSSLSSNWLFFSLSCDWQSLSRSNNISVKTVSKLNIFNFITILNSFHVDHNTENVLGPKRETYLLLHILLFNLALFFEMISKFI